MERIIKDEKIIERAREKSVQVITTKQSKNNLITLTEESHKQHREKSARNSPNSQLESHSMIIKNSDDCPSIENRHNRIDFLVMKGQNRNQASNITSMNHITSEDDRNNISIQSPRSEHKSPDVRQFLTQNSESQLKLGQNNKIKIILKTQPTENEGTFKNGKSASKQISNTQKLTEVQSSTKINRKSTGK